jgi:hypothetical protein
MPAATSSTRWRDQPIIPEDYKDVPALVKLARKARWQPVEFDWSFSRDDLQHLRRAAYEWGSGVRGAYKYFDARVLAAINSALGETDSILVLNEPKNMDWLDCAVACVPDGHGFRLQGRAPFTIVFGYGAAAVQDSGDGRAFLGPTVRATLATSVGAGLGWDLHGLQDKLYQPVRNAMYGLPLDYGGPDVPPHPGPELDIDVDFQGPFSALDKSGCRCLFSDPIAAKSGVYLWTTEVDGVARPWYVGQTRRGFGQRMAEHVANMLSGRYVQHDPEALSRGDSTRLCDGSVSPNWPLTLPAFLGNAEELTPQILAVIRLVRFHVAPLEGDQHLYDRAEGAIGRYYKAHPVPELRSFISPGLRLPAAIPGDQRLRLVLSSEAPIAGLPVEILEPGDAATKSLTAPPHSPI